MYHCMPSGPLPSLFKQRSLGPRWPRTRGTSVKIKEMHKQNQNLLLQNHYSQIFEIKCVALSTDLPPNLFKWWPWGPKCTRPGVLCSNHRNRWKILKNLLQNHLLQMLEIRYVALSGGLLPSSFKRRSEGPKWPYARGSWA